MDFVTAARRISSHVRVTPLVRSEWLSQACSGTVHLKLENEQDTGSFKLRGAANKLLRLPPEVAALGPVTASTGNHAIAVATIGRKLSVPVDVFVSGSIHPQRQEKIEKLGARVHKVPGDCLLAEQTARHHAQRAGRTYISPYNDACVIEGQGTIGVEIQRQLHQQGCSTLDAVFVAVGGGGLISGVAGSLTQSYPKIDVIGCWPHHSPVMYECLKAGRVIPVHERPTLSVSTAGGLEEGTITFELCRKLITHHSLVSESDIAAALTQLYRHDGILAEGAAGVAVASCLQLATHYAGKTIVIIICGGNMDRELEKIITGK